MKEEKRLFANVEFNLETATQTIANLVSQNANLKDRIDKTINILLETKKYYCVKECFYKINEALKMLGGNNENN